MDFFNDFSTFFRWHLVVLLIQVLRSASQGSYEPPPRRLQSPDERACDTVVSTEACVSVGIDAWSPYVGLYVGALTPTFKVNYLQTITEIINKVEKKVNH